MFRLGLELAGSPETVNCAHATPGERGICTYRVQYYLKLLQCNFRFDWFSVLYMS